MKIPNRPPRATVRRKIRPFIRLNLPFVALRFAVRIFY